MTARSAPLPSRRDDAVVRVVVAPDKFKGSLSAAEAADNLAAGLRAAGVEAECVPVADGGDGTVAAMTSADYDIHSVEVTGPLGQKVTAKWARGPALGETDGRWVRDEAGPRRDERSAPTVHSQRRRHGRDGAVAGAHDTPAAGSRVRVEAVAVSRPAVPAARPPWPGGLGTNLSAPTAVIELAQASGLRYSAVTPDAALRASSRGTGELLRAARQAGCRRIVMGLGGSACTDGGAGMLQALGVRLLDADGRDLAPGGAALRRLSAIDTAGVPRDWHDIDVVVAGDVDNPLLGRFGAAAVYGPQKGATATEVGVLEAGLANLARIVDRDLGIDAAATAGAGAAGGVGYGALALLGARLHSGIDLVLSLLDFEARLAGADLVVTGEGRLDTQTLRGKAPAGVAAAAARAGVPTIAVAGVCELTGDELAESGIRAVYRLSDLQPDPDRSIRDAGPLLRRLGGRIAADLLKAPEAAELESAAETAGLPNSADPPGSAGPLNPADSSEVADPPASAKTPRPAGLQNSANRPGPAQPPNPATGGGT
ncbi:MAG: glycerate kinase [Stackebrandtia sp.]